MRALRKLTRCIAATQAALYSDETYDKLRRLFGRVSRQPASTSSSVERHYQKVETALNEATRKRLDDLLKDTTTEKCREEVTSTFIDSYKRQISEDWLPFERTGYVSDCPSQRDNAPRAKRLRAEDIRLAYLLVVHETPQQITRLIEALEEGTRHNFIIHVDDKPQSESTYNYLRKYASQRSHVHVLETGRQSVAWGGFNVVQATLNGLAYALDVLDGKFDWIVTASGYTYRSRRTGDPRRTRKAPVGHGVFGDPTPAQRPHAAGLAPVRGMRRQDAPDHAVATPQKNQNVHGLPVDGRHARLRGLCYRKGSFAAATAVHHGRGAVRALRLRPTRHGRRGRGWSLFRF